MINPLFFRKLPESTQVFVSNLLGEWSILGEEEDLLKLISGISLGPKDEELETKGFINTSVGKDKHFLQAAELRLANKFSKNTQLPSLIMIVPTLRCDHDCLYCQVSRAPLQSIHHDLKLSPKNLANAINKIAAVNFKLEIQGGEPMLRPDFIQDLVCELRKLRGASFSIVITTALGPNLSVDFLDWAVIENVEFSVSFDGIPSVHRKIRKSKLFDSFDRMEQQLLRLSAAGLRERVGFVHTISKETITLGVDAIIDSCRNLGISRLYSRPLADYGFAVSTKKNIGYSRKDLDVFYANYLDRIIDCFHSGENFFDYAFGVHLKNLYQPEKNCHVDIQSPAGYGLSACVINYDGHIFGSDEARMLYESTKNSLLPIGVVHDKDILINPIQPHINLLSSSFSEISPHCETCAYMPFCGSDPIHHLAAQGDFVGSKPNSEFCKQTMIISDLLIKRIGQGNITDEMVVQWLSH